jgi:type IV pilus assembly protein PilC
MMLWTPIFGKLIRKTWSRASRGRSARLIGRRADPRGGDDHEGDERQLRLRAGAQKVHDSIREGESFAQPLRESKTCDAIVVNMIDVGEETGDLDAMLMKIADNYDEEVDVAVASLVSCSSRC